MKAEGIEPDGVTYTILMTIFGAAAQPELAWGVYQELRQKVREEAGGVVLTQRQYGAILAVSGEGLGAVRGWLPVPFRSSNLGLLSRSWCAKMWSGTAPEVRLSLRHLLSGLSSHCGLNWRESVCSQRA